MTEDNRFQQIRAIIAEEQNALPPQRASDMAAAIREKHGDTIQAFLFYGSGLREAENIEKMLDYYVLARKYTDVHGFGPKALGSFALPPSVHYLESVDQERQPMNGKYAIMSVSAFRRRVIGRAREPMIWARFSQPCLIMSCSNSELRELLITDLAKAVIHFIEEVVPMVNGKISPAEFWSRALAESYRTELRAERPLERATEIVERYKPRYDALAQAYFGPVDADGMIAISAVSSFRKFSCRLKWATRRWVGKPATSLRVLKAAFTFDGGLDYVLHKLTSHSGKNINFSDTERRHPVLLSPIIAWKIWRSGALGERHL